MNKPINYELTKAISERNKALNLRGPWFVHRKQTPPNPEQKPRNIARRPRKEKITLATKVSFLDDAT